MLTESDKLFLDALKASVRNEKIDRDEKLTADGLIKLFRTAEIHNVFPLIYNSVYGSTAADGDDVKHIFSLFKSKALNAVTAQTKKTDSFLSMYSEIADAGIMPVVIKGIVCRNLYPQPDYRMSSDEDMYIDVCDYEKCRSIMQNAGLRCSSADEYECKFISSKDSLCIELSKMLFAHSLEAFDRFNRYFPEAADCGEYITVGGVRLRTLEPTDHFFYLICHAVKHFIHCGFGIRQICDMMLFAENYGDRIDWERIQIQCREVNADKFVNAVISVCRKHLGLDCVKACIPESMANDDIDEIPLLDDILDGGIYGKADPTRLHSANITMNAALSENGSGKVKHILKSIFPSAKQMKADAEYLKDKPYLLPAAWVKRIAKYSQKTVRTGKLSDAAESVKIGSQRIGLMKMYGIIDG